MVLEFKTFSTVKQIQNKKIKYEIKIHNKYCNYKKYKLVGCCKIFYVKFL